MRAFLGGTVVVPAAEVQQAVQQQEGRSAPKSGSKRPRLAPGVGRAQGQVAQVAPEAGLGGPSRAGKQHVRAAGPRRGSGGSGRGIPGAHQPQADSGFGQPEA